MSRSRTLTWITTRRLPSSRLTWLRPSEKRNGAVSLTFLRRQHDRQRAEHAEVVALVARYPNDNVEPSIALEHLTSLPASHGGGDRIGDLFDGEAEARDGGAIEA